MSIQPLQSQLLIRFNTFLRRQSGLHFADYIFKLLFQRETMKNKCVDISCTGTHIFSNKGCFTAREALVNRYIAILGMG